MAQSTQETSRTTARRAREYSSGHAVIGTKESLPTTTSTGSECSTTSPEGSTRATGEMAREQVVESSSCPAVTVLLEISSIITSQDLTLNATSRTVVCTKVPWSILRKKGKESSSGVLERDMLETSKTASEKDTVCTISPMEQFSRVTGKMISNMDTELSKRMERSRKESGRKESRRRASHK